MTNKRKKLARELTAKGMSYQAAINSLTKTEDRPKHCVVSPRGVARTNLRELVLHDKQEGLSDEVKVGSTPYPKSPGQTAYIIGVDGSSILAIQKPKHVLVPFVKYLDEEEIGIRLAALFEATAVSCEDNLYGVELATLKSSLQHHLHQGELKALLVDPQNVQHVLRVSDDTPVYTAPVGRYVFGLSTPDRVGVLAESTEGTFGMIVNHREGGITFAVMS